MNEVVDNTQIRSWWWGRTLPEEDFKTIDLSDLTKEDVKRLRDLKQLVELAEEKGIELPFGQYMKRGDLYKDKPDTVLGDGTRIEWL